jgi:hypothetical protein
VEQPSEILRAPALEQQTLGHPVDKLYQTVRIAMQTEIRPNIQSFLVADKGFALWRESSYRQSHLSQ